MGSQGETGPTGPQGDMGPVGATGPTGPVGGFNKQVIFNDNGTADGSEIYYDKASTNVSIGTSVFTEKLSVHGVIQSETGGFKFPDGTVQTTATSGISPPIGTVMPWLKSYQNTPGLPDGWVECNGQVLSDQNSPYDGQTIPNLNGADGGTARFLRGSIASGGTGGADSVTLTVNEMPSHSHSVYVDYGHNYGPGDYKIGDANKSQGVQYTCSTNATGGNQAHENRPSFYEVVWIMRIK